MNCKFCNDERKNANSLRNHERLCKLNPDKQVSSFAKMFSNPDFVSWNKGLTKETDQRIAKNAKSVGIAMKKLYDSGFRTKLQNGEYWTDERRRLKSEWRKALHKEHPETHPNVRLANNRTKVSYPEQIAFDWLTENSIMFEHQKHIGKYFVDFCIDKTIIEIDGERWHPIGNEPDRLRDLALSELGYTIFRIRSKERIKDKLKEILLKI